MHQTVVGPPLSPLGGRLGQRIGHRQFLAIGPVISAAGLPGLAPFSSFQAGVVASIAVFGTDMGPITVGNTELLSCFCSKEILGTATDVNSMVPIIGMSVQSLPVQGFEDPFGGYGYCGDIVVAIALIAGTCVEQSEAERGGHHVSRPAPPLSH